MRKENVFNNAGGGITGRIFVDGMQVFSELVDNFDDDPTVSIVNVDVMVGSFIDFAIDPTGVLPLDTSRGDGIFSPRADGMSARIGLLVGVGAVTVIWATARAAIAWPWFVLMGTAITIAVGGCMTWLRSRR